VTSVIVGGVESSTQTRAVVPPSGVVTSDPTLVET